MTEFNLNLQFPEFKNNFNKIYTNSIKQYKKDRKYSIITSTVLVFVIALVGIISIFGYVNSNKVYGFDDLKPKIIGKDVGYIDSASFPAYFSPLPSKDKVYHEEMDDEYLSYFIKALSKVGLSENSEFYGVSGEIVRYNSGEFCALTLGIGFSEGGILISVDANNYPTHIFRDNKSIKINGYDVAMIATGDFSLNDELVCDIYMVGLKKDEMGIRLMLDNQDYIEELKIVFDLIVSGEIDFEEIVNS